MKTKQLNQFIVLILVILVAEVVIWSVFRKPAITVYPAAEFAPELFSDRSNGEGTSDIDTVSEAHSLTVNYTLVDDFKWPFAGIRFNPDSTINLMKYDNVTFDIDLKKESSEIIILWSAPFIHGTDSTTEQPYHYEITLSPNQRSYTIPLNSFLTPLWWLTMHGIGQNDLPEDRLKYVTGVGIRSSFQPTVGTEHSFAIRKIVLSKNHTVLYVQMVLFALVALIIFVVRVKWQNALSRRLVVPLKDLQIEDGTNNLLHRVITVIGDQCDNPDLSLFNVAQMSEASEVEVSKSIKDEFGLNFKQYLNRVRMEIATTLLRESDLSIKEIAFKSGYKTNSHFFRVFRTFYNESPSEYRKRMAGNS